jgi:hypothetical protein
MNNVSFLFLSALTGAALVLSGCGKANEKASEKLIEKSLRNSGAKGAQVDLSKGKMTVKTDEGEMELSTGEAASIPADFPKDVCTIKGAKIQMAMKTPQGFMLQMKVDRAMGEIAESYGTEMKAQGWAQETSMDMGEMNSRVFKKEKSQVALVVTKDGAASDVMLTLTADE